MGKECSGTDRGDHGTQNDSTRGSSNRRPGRASLASETRLLGTVRAKVPGRPRGTATGVGDEDPLQRVSLCLAPGRPSPTSVTSESPLHSLTGLCWPLAWRSFSRDWGGMSLFSKNSSRKCPKRDLLCYCVLEFSGFVRPGGPAHRLPALWSAAPQAQSGRPLLLLLKTENLEESLQKAETGVPNSPSPPAHLPAFASYSLGRFRAEHRLRSWG